MNEAACAMALHSQGSSGAPTGLKVMESKKAEGPCHSCVISPALNAPGLVRNRSEGPVWSPIDDPCPSPSWRVLLLEHWESEKNKAQGTASIIRGYVQKRVKSEPVRDASVLICKCIYLGEGTPPPSKSLEPGTQYMEGKKCLHLPSDQGRVLVPFLF